MTTDRIGALGRRGVLKGLAAGGALTAAGGFPGFIQAQSSAPIVLGFQLHRTGIGAAYGRWYERTASAALTVLNEAGGINGRPVEIVFEDDGTDPKRGAEVVEKFASQNVDAVFGALFSHVVVGTAPRAGELKMPYLVCSEGHHVASGALNRWTLQPGITDVKSQVQSMAPWVAANLGKKVTLIYPDYAFGYDHRDFFSAAMQAQGGEVIELLAIPPTETSFTRYLPRIPPETEVLYHVMVGPAVLTFVKELGEFYGGGGRPQIFGFIDSLEAVDIASPGLEFLEGTHFWEGHPRYKQPDASEHETFYRAAVARRRQRRLADRRERGLDLRPHVLHLGDALHHQGGDGGRRLPGPRRPPGLRRGDGGDDRHAALARAPAGRQGVQRQDPPGLRPPVDLQGRGRQARRRAHHLDRGRPLPGRGGLHHASLLSLGLRPLPAARHARRPGHGRGARADRRRPLPRLRRDARRQRRPRRVLHARRRHRLVRRAAGCPAAPRSASSRRSSSARSSPPLVAVALDRLVLRRLDYEPEAVIVATIGFGYILQQGALSLYGPEARAVAAPFDLPLQLPWFGYSGYKLAVDRRRRA